MRKADALGARAGWLVAVALVCACSDPAYLEVKLDELEKSSGGAAEQDEPVFRFSIAAIESPTGTYRTYSPFVEQLGVRLGTRIELLQRRTYREVNDLLLDGQLDAAILCTGGYFDLRRRDPGAVEIVAVPVLNGRTTYPSLVIVPARSQATRIEDLAGKRFAFTDELSFSGHEYVMALLRRRGLDPKRFFGSTSYTRSHDRSIATVAEGLVDGAGVHGKIFDHLVAERPELARRVRVIHRSEEFGGLPIVVSTRLPPVARARLRDALLSFASEPQGVAALRTLGVDRFIVPAPAAFEPAARFLETSR